MRRSAHVSEALGARIKAAIDKHGQLHKRGLCRALDCTYTALDGTMADLQRRGEIIILGTARDAGFDGRWDAPVYGLPGMTFKRADAPKPKEKSGSGVIAESRHVLEFRPLVRDPFEHWNLAMATRR